MEGESYFLLSINPVSLNQRWFHSAINKNKVISSENFHEKSKLNNYTVIHNHHNIKM